MKIPDPKIIRKAKPARRMRPLGLSRNRASPSERGTRTRISRFCLWAVFGTESNSRIEKRTTEGRPLLATRPGVEVQTHGIGGQIHTNGIPHVDADSIPRVTDMHVIFRDGKTQRSRLLGHPRAEYVV